MRIRRRLRYTAGSHIEGPPVASEADVPNCNHCSVEGAIAEVLVERILPSEGQSSMVRWPSATWSRQGCFDAHGQSIRGTFLFGDEYVVTPDRS